MIDLCIIGAGAAGMSAAITAKRENPKLNIAILEKKESPGKKIIASGNGKCNLSNIKCKNNQEILDFFNIIGVITRADSQGRIYPYTEESKVVVKAMTDELAKLGVIIETGASVSSVTKDKAFVIKTQNGNVYNAKMVMVACGGKAAPKLGTTGDGYIIARSLGHTVTKLVPALTAIDVKENIKNFAGIRAKGNVTLYFQGESIFSEDGEIQFTKDGLSGICIFNMSRFLLIPPGKTIADGFTDYEIEIDFLPDYKELEKLIEYRQKNLKLGSAEILQSLVREPIGKAIINNTGANSNELATSLHHYKLHPKGAKGWDFAQVTKGGVILKEINMETMESKLCQGLYFGGEVIDFDGPCGGYNLQNAWETGIKAGRNIANV